MELRFCVLASGSAGNAALLQIDSYGILLDLGLGPRQMASRMQTYGIGWQDVHAVFLTHTHGDHWKERTFAHLRRRRIPLYCHRDHQPSLMSGGGEFAKLRVERLVAHYEPYQEVFIAPEIRCLPIALCHDGAPTFGFRFEMGESEDSAGCAVAYIADLGCWSAELAEMLADVDILALEFNHDVEMEYSSGRSPRLIQRVLGDHGHLSNEQAAGLLAEILQRSEPGRLRHLVQLHLSRDCNCPSIAQEAARGVLSRLGSTPELHTAAQDRPGPHLRFSPPEGRGRVMRRPAIVLNSQGSPQRKLHVQGWLPGCDW